MKKSKRNHEEAELPEEFVEPYAEGESSAGENAVGSETERLRSELEETREHWQRALADYQNLRKRTFSDVESAVRRSKHEMLSELLLVLDYLDMALASPIESADGRNLLAGVQMTRDQLWNVMQNQGVSPISSEGRFDPSVHQAFESVDDPAREPGEIVSTVRKGFRLGDHVLRHAQVRVVSAPEVESAAETTAGDED